jgi:hypothetical protein
MCVEGKFFVSHSLQQSVGEVFKNFAVRFCIDLPLEGPRFSINPYVSQRVVVVVICQPVQHFETLAYSEDGPTQPVFIGLFDAVLVYFSSRFVVLR